MIGTIANVAAILAGGTAGLLRVKELALGRQVLIKKLLGVFTVWVGLNMMWEGFNGSFWQVGRQFLIMLAALTLGHASGRWLRFQSLLSRVGQYAKRQLAAGPAASRQGGAGFIACALLYCVGPLSVLGSLQDGLFGNPRTLIIKSCMDGLAAMGFARSLGWGVVLSPIPVLAYQGSLTLLAQWLAPLLRQHLLLDSISASAGLLIFSVALVMLDLSKLELVNYLPALIFAPLLTWIWH